MADVMTGGEVGPWWRWRPPASRVLPEMSRGQERGGQRASEAFYSEGVHYSWWWVVWVVLAGDQVPAGVCPRAGNEPSRRLTFHNHGEGSYQRLLVESTYYRFHIQDTVGHYAKRELTHCK